MQRIVKWPLIAGIILFIGGPAIGLLATVIAMIGAFNTASESGPADPEKLSADISTSLMTTAIGIPVGILGAILLIFSLVAYLITRNHNPSHHPVDATP